MVEAISDWLQKSWGDLASALGLVVAVIGFLLTIRAARGSKTAAERAEGAVRQVKADLLRVDTIADLTAALGAIGEIKRLHRARVWHSLPDRYSELRRRLTAIRSSQHPMEEAQRTEIQGAIQQFATMERSVERHLAGGRTINVARFNHIASEQIDRLTEVLVNLRQGEG